MSRHNSSQTVRTANRVWQSLREDDSEGAPSKLGERSTSSLASYIPSYTTADDLWRSERGESFELR